jgi:pyruvate,water dikinase
MMDAYEMYSNDDQNYQHKMAQLAPAIYRHLRTEYDTGKYTNRDIDKSFTLMEDYLERLDRGTVSPIQAMEIVRNEIHKNDVLKQIAVCGGTFTDSDNMATTAQVLKVALQLLADDTPQSAREPLEQFYAGLDCAQRLSGRKILWAKDVNEENSFLVGGKAANLAEMAQANIPVAPLFVVTSNVYFDFLKQTGIVDQVRALIAPLDVTNTRQLQEVAARVQEIILATPMSEGAASEIREAYETLNRGKVAVRSTVPGGEDLPDASFAGQQRSFLNVQGDDDVVIAVQKCWASLFTPRAIFYRKQNNIDDFKVGMAVIVQRMVNADASGVMFTIQPEKCDEDSMTIEAAKGLGEPIASGEITPDHYEVDKGSLKITSKQIKPQTWALLTDKGQVPLTEDEKASQKVTDQDIEEVAEIGKRLEKYYRSPQDVEWAKDQGKIFINQTRSITTIDKTKKILCTIKVEVSQPPILTGTAASPGMASGPCRLILDPFRIGEVEQGDIVVAKMTDPDYVPIMKRAAAIITDKGGTLSHAAIVARELSLPCVVGTEQATTILKDGDIVTVDGTSGKVYSGTV